jgi:hypothetical protein
MTSNDTDQPDVTPQATQAQPPADTLGRFLLRSIRGHGRIMRTFAVLAVAAIVGAAYVVGGPPDGAHAVSAPADGRNAFSSSKDLSGGTQLAAVAPGAADQKSLPGSGGAASTITTPGGESALLAQTDTAQIIKTGQMSLEVTAIGDAVTRATAAISGLGGSVQASNQYGTGNDTVSSITYAVPVAKWGEALSEMHKIGSKIISEQTNTTDVTTQVIDLDARITNLQATESALQAIMARASAIPDVIAVQSQLTETRGQIESLTAQSRHLKDQAAMSTLTVTFQMPSKTVITEATQDWTLSNQIDQAGAALVRIGQGLATLGVWIIVVVLPVALVLAVLFAIMVVVRRLRRRGRNAAAAA